MEKYLDDLPQLAVEIFTYKPVLKTSKKRRLTKKSKLVREQNAKQKTLQ